MKLGSYPRTETERAHSILVIIHQRGGSQVLEKDISGLQKWQEAERRDRESMCSYKLSKENALK